MAAVTGQVEQTTAPLLESAQQLASRLSSLLARVLDVESKLDALAASETKSTGEGAQPISPCISSFLDESHGRLTALEQTLGRIHERLGEA